MPLIHCQTENAAQYTKVWRAKVLSCKAGARYVSPSLALEAKANKKGKTKKGKKNKKQQDDNKASEPAQVYDVELSDTILFPEGGGQPTDLGSLNGVPVTYVYRGSRGQAVHQTETALEVGTEVEIQLDWTRYVHATPDTHPHSSPFYRSFVPLPLVLSPLPPTGGSIICKCTVPNTSSPP